MRKTIIAGMAVCGASASSFAADLPALMQAPLPTLAVPGVAPPIASDFYAHIGAAGFIPDAGARISLGGVRVPGASIRVPATVTAAVEIGYHITPNWAVSLSTGLPPTSEVYGTGTVARLGKLGSSVAGPVAITAHYHFLGLGAFQPYVGGGAAYLIVFDSKDAALSRYRLNESFGAVGQIGADWMITDRIGLYVDVKKGYLRTTASGLMAGLPVRSKVKLDPAAVTGGVTICF